MKTESLVRSFAGTMILLSLLLAYYLNPWWLTLAAFVGVSLFQAGFTGNCPADYVFRRFRREGRDGGDAASPGAR